MARELQKNERGTYTLYLNEEQLGVVLDAVRNWDNTLSGRFAMIEPWDWPGSYSPDETSYRKCVSQVLALVSDD